MESISAVLAMPGLKGAAAIQQVLDNYDTIKANIEAHKSQFLWDSQEGVIKEIVEKYLG